MAAGLFPRCDKTLLHQGRGDDAVCRIRLAVTTPRPRAPAGEVDSSRFHWSARTGWWNQIDESVVPLRWLRAFIECPCTCNAGSIMYTSVT